MSLLSFGTKITRRRRATKQEIQQAVMLYKANASLIHILEETGVSENTVRKYARKIGMTIPPRGGRTLYTHNPSAFDVITPESAYWLGFFTGDGRYDPRNNHSIGSSPIFRVGVAEIDIGHLEKLRSFLQSNQPIGLYKQKNNPNYMAILSITSQGLCNALDGYGLAKPSLERLPTVGLIQNRHFWRGCIDADGHVAKPGIKKYKSWTINLCGHYELLLMYQDYIASIGITTSRVPKPTHSIYYLSIHGENAKKLMRHLYQPGDVYLERKGAIALIAGNPGA